MWRRDEAPIKDLFGIDILQLTERPVQSPKIISSQARFNVCFSTNIFQVRHVGLFSVQPWNLRMVTIKISRTRDITTKLSICLRLCADGLIFEATAWCTTLGWNSSGGVGGTSLISSLVLCVKLFTLENICRHDHFFLPFSRKKKHVSAVGWATCSVQYSGLDDKNLSIPGQFQCKNTSSPRFNVYYFAAFMYRIMGV